MDKEQVDKWLNEEYGMTFEELEELHDFQCDRVIEKEKLINELEKFMLEEKERLVKETSNTYEDSFGRIKDVNEDVYCEICDILDKLKELRGDKE